MQPSDAVGDRYQSLHGLFRGLQRLAADRAAAVQRPLHDDRRGVIAQAVEGLAQNTRRTCRALYERMIVGHRTPLDFRAVLRLFPQNRRCSTRQAVLHAGLFWSVSSSGLLWAFCSVSRTYSSNAAGDCLLASGIASRMRAARHSLRARARHKSARSTAIRPAGSGARTWRRRQPG